MSVTTEHELVVSEIFGPTFQGEGTSVGRRCGFLRLGGCNLDCSWCDTPYTWDWTRFNRDDELRRMQPAEVVAAVSSMGVDMLVITGGEPLLQQRALLPVLQELRGRGWRLEVETNGTVSPGSETATLVNQFNVSPKLANSGVPEVRRIRPDVLATLMASHRAVFKFVVTSVADFDELDRIVARHALSPVWVMPEGTEAAQVLESLRRLAEPSLARGYHLSPRLHVLLWEDVRGR